MLQFNFKITHIAGSFNTATDFLSRLELKITEKIRLKIREDIQTIPIEVTTFFSDVADEEQFFFTQADNNDESEEQTLEQKEQLRQNVKQWAANEESSALKASVKNSQKSTETLRRIPWMESNQMQEYEWHKMSILCRGIWNWKF